MPRISAAALGVVPVAELEFPPPAHLSEAEKIVFRDVVGSADPGHFRCEDRELLALYCAQVVAARTLMKRRAASGGAGARSAGRDCLDYNAEHQAETGTEIESAGQQEGSLGGYAQTRAKALGPARGIGGSAGSGGEAGRTALEQFNADGVTAAA